MESNETVDHKSNCQSDEADGYAPCPNCNTPTLETDFKASFNYATLLECPSCKAKVKPNNKAYISDIPYI